MAGLPSFPTSRHKWIGVLEARLPLIQDLIKIWEESPGYILPQGSFIKDKVKLEALIDSLIEMEKNKKNSPQAPAPRPLTSLVNLPSASPSTQTKSEDPNWEKNLVKALSASALSVGRSEVSLLPSPAPVPASAASPLAAIVPKSDSPLLPEAAKAEIARLESMKADLIKTEVPKTDFLSQIKAMTTKGSATQEGASIHLIFLYAISLSAFILACYAIRN